MRKFTCITLKYVFPAFILFGYFSVNFLQIIRKSSVLDTIPAGLYQLIILPFLINFGIVIKEREITFPIVTEFLKNFIGHNNDDRIYPVTA